MVRQKPGKLRRNYHGYKISKYKYRNKENSDCDKGCRAS